MSTATITTIGAAAAADNGVMSWADYKEDADAHNQTTATAGDPWDMLEDEAGGDAGFDEDADDNTTMAYYKNKNRKNGKNRGGKNQSNNDSNNYDGDEAPPQYYGPVQNWDGKAEGREPEGTTSWSSVIEGREWHFTAFKSNENVRGDARFLYRGHTPLFQRTKREWTTLLPCPYAARASKGPGSTDAFGHAFVRVRVPGKKATADEPAVPERVDVHRASCHYNVDDKKSAHRVLASLLTGHATKGHAGPTSWSDLVQVVKPGEDK